MEAVASLAVALRLRGELSGDADGPLACALSRWLEHDSDGAQRAVRALSRGERLEDFVDAVRERSSSTPQTPGKGRVRADPLLAALQAHLRAHAHTGDAEGKAARALVEAALEEHHGSDNVSVTLVALQPPPLPLPVHVDLSLIHI